MALPNQLFIVLHSGFSVFFMSLLSSRRMAKIGILLVLIFVVVGTAFFLSQRGIDESSQQLFLQIKACATANGGNFGSESEHCLKNLAREVIQTSSLPRALSSLADIQQNKSTASMFTLYCHSFTHFLGQYEYHKTKSVSAVYQECTSACDGGCWHGAIEGYFQEKKIALNEIIPDVLKNEVKTICGNTEQYSLLTHYTQCIHGLGHALMFLTDGELFQSLKFCDVLEGEHDRVQCYLGVFMENDGGVTSAHPSRFISEADPQYPCADVDAPYQWSCYFNKGPYFARIARGDWKQMIQLCSSVKTENGRFACFFGMGETLVTLVAKPDAMKAQCALINDAVLKDYCIRGVAVSLMTVFAGDSPRVIRFCEIVDEENKRNCYLQWGFELKKWVHTAQEAQQLCATMREKEYLQWCKKAVTEPVS